MRLSRWQGSETSQRFKVHLTQVSTVLTWRVGGLHAGIAQVVHCRTNISEHQFVGLIWPAREARPIITYNFFTQAALY